METQPVQFSQFSGEAAWEPGAWGEEGSQVRGAVQQGIGKGTGLSIQACLSWWAVPQWLQSVFISYTF